MLHKINNENYNDEVQLILAGTSVPDYNAIVDAINKYTDVQELVEWFEARPRFQRLAKLILPTLERSIA